MYLKLPWIGNISLKLKKQVKSNAQNCFKTVDACVIFQTRKILPSIDNDVVPITHQSMVVYQYVCRCGCRYVGRTGANDNRHFHVNYSDDIFSSSIIVLLSIK